MCFNSPKTASLMDDQSNPNWKSTKKDEVSLHKTFVKQGIITLISTISLGVFLQEV